VLFLSIIFLHFCYVALSKDVNIHVFANPAPVEIRLFSRAINNIRVARAASSDVIELLRLPFERHFHHLTYPLNYQLTHAWHLSNIELISRPCFSFAEGAL